MSDVHDQHEPTPPHDDDAERAVLGACMATPGVAADVARTLSPADFWQPAHETVMAAIAELVAAGNPTDPIAVLDQLRKAGMLGRAGGMDHLHTLQAAAAIPSAVGYHVGIITDTARRRAVIEAAARLAAQARKPDSDIEEVIDQTSTAMSGLRFGQSDGDDLSSMLDLDEFVAQPLPPEDWIIPSLLATGDRLVLTGGEGLGKTTLIRQIAVCAAAGLHPFTLVPHQQRRVLVIDAENPKRIMIDRFSQLRDACRRRQVPVPPGHLWIDRRPDGLDLARRDDQRWLARRVEGVQPDLLVIGPVYKLYLGGAGQREEDLARTVTSVLDEIRELAGCALVLEHHSPHGSGFGSRTIRPIGSSLWLRWPEFGYGISLADIQHNTLKSRVVDFDSWRGPRDERPWPDRLQPSRDGWPWMEAPPG